MTNPTSQPRVLRLATSADAAALAELGQRTFTEAFGADNTPADLAAFLAGAYSERIQTEELASPDLTYILTEIAGVAVAFALLRRGTVSEFVDDTTAVELQRLYVDKAWHGSGLAQALMDECVRIATAEGAGSLFLGVWERNARALRFYSAQGFVPVGQHIFTVGSDPQTDTIMVRRLRD